MKKNLYFLFKALLLLSVTSASAQTDNYFAGYQSGISNTTGDFNAFAGYRAGRSNNIGSYNSFFGSNAGFANTSGGQNTFLGSLAGNSNTTGQGNTFIGSTAGNQNTTGSFNTFIGLDAGMGNNGNSNTYVGYLVGAYTFGSGNNNAFFGSGVAYYNSGSFNAIFGASAGANNLGGGFNVYFGAESGVNAQTANSNTFLGFRSGYRTTYGSTNSYIGREAGFNGTSAFNNTLLGYQSGYSTSSGNHNTFIGLGAGYNNTTGQFNTSLGIYSGPTTGTLVNANAIGQRARVSISNAMVLGSINGINGAVSDTRIGIRTMAPAYSLHLNAPDAAKVGGGSWVIASDKRLKQDISNFEEGLDMLANIQPVWFRYNGKAGIVTQKRFVGVIAQDVQKIAPYTVGEFEYMDTAGNKEKYLDFDPNSLTYILINSVKQQQRKIDSLENEILEIKQMLISGNPGLTTEAKLWQNQPNPADGSTMITYFIPQKSRISLLNIYAMSGQLVQSINITGKGKGSYNVSSKSFAVGTYSYQLVVDGRIVDNKKLVLVR